MQRRKERGPVSCQMVDNQALAIGQIGRRTGLSKLRDVVGQVEREAPIVFAEGLEAAPDDLAGSRQGIEVGRLIPFDPSRQDLGLEDRRDERRALQVLDGIEQRVEPGDDGGRRPASA